MNQTPLRTLFLWTVWAAAAIIIYGTLYQNTEVWEFVRQDPSRITWIILGMFGLGVVASFVLAVNLSLEHLVAFRIDEAVRDNGLAGLPQLRRRWAVQRFFRGLKLAVDGNGKPDPEALTHVELAFYQRISHTLEVLGNLLITLGLIGTVMGLTLTLTGLTSSLEALGEDQEQLLSGLRQAMTGMGTAFYTTLLGAVLGGVLLRVFAQITDHGVDSLHDNLMRTVLVHCSADLQPSMHRDMKALEQEVEQLERRMDVLGRILNNSRVAMSDFREEMDRLREASEAESEVLLEQLRRHQQCARMLQHEVQLMRRVNRPFWARVKAIFRP